MIVLMSLVRSSLKDLHNLRLIQEIQRGIAATKGKMPLKVANTIFILLYYCFIEDSGVWTAEVFGQHSIFGYVDIICLDMI
jgi:hypothetical protein